MRTVRFRDILWGCAYKIGLAPHIDLDEDQARSLASYINEEVRNAYDSADFPEWTQIRQLVPDTNHMVPYVVQLGGILGTETIGRVFKVYLVDPRTTSIPVDTPHKLRDDGIFVGLEHGTSVWIKYIPSPPQFTSEQWLVDVTYKRGELVYSPKSGECYKSRTENNVGHDPTIIFSPRPPLVSEIIQERTPDNPGTVVKHKIIDVLFRTTIDIPNPPPNGSQFYVPVLDSTGLLAAGVHTANGIESQAAILAIIVGQLQAALPTFTITGDALNLVIRVDGAQEFNCGKPFYVPAGGPIYYLQVNNVQAFIPATGQVDGVPQITKVNITQDDVLTGATYDMVVTDEQGMQHIVSYTAQQTDSAVQILSGLTDAMAVSTDAFFLSVNPVIDTALLTLSLTTADQASVSVSVGRPGSAWWELEQFPFILMNQVINGAYAIDLKEKGQADKSAEEEQSAGADATAAATKILMPSSNILTDQQKSRPRFSVGQQ